MSSAFVRAFNFRAFKISAIQFRAMQFQRKHIQNSIYYPHNGVDTLVNTVYTTLRLSYNEIAFSNVYAEVERADLCHTPSLYSTVIILESCFKQIGWERWSFCRKQGPETQEPRSHSRRPIV